MRISRTSLNLQVFRCGLLRTAPPPPQASYISNFSEAVSDQRSVRGVAALEVSMFQGGNTLVQKLPRNPFDAQPLEQTPGMLSRWCRPEHMLHLASSEWAACEQQGLEFSDQDFGGQGDVMGFLAMEEQECLKDNPFIEEEVCDASAAQAAGGVNSSVFSGVS